MSQAPEVRMKLRPWLVPNFAIVEVPPRSRQQGFSPEATSIHIRDLDPEILSAMADDWRRRLFTHAGKEDPVKR